VRPSRTQTDRPTTRILHPIQRFSACESAHFGATVDDSFLVGPRRTRSRPSCCHRHEPTSVNGTHPNSPPVRRFLREASCRLSVRGLLSIRSRCRPAAWTTLGARPRAWSQRELHDSQSAGYNHDRSTNEAGGCALIGFHPVSCRRLRSRASLPSLHSAARAVLYACSNGQMRLRSLSFGGRGLSIAAAE